MRNIGLLFLILSLFSQCKTKEKDFSSLNNDLYNIINSYTEAVNKESESPLVVVVFERTIPLTQSILEKRGGIPNPPGSLYSENIYDVNFEILQKREILNEEDVAFMKTQLIPIDVPYNERFFYLLDSAYVSLPIMTEMEYEEMFSISKDAYNRWNEFRSKYDGCYIAFSNPIFNENKSKVYFQATEMCGRLYGHGEIVVMERNNGGWKIIYWEETWVS
ncbi:hypothetical protein LJC52_05355 [Bacteroidales bacterium OttesenSCG-928-A17]|nr:hypothetical protein [Bacteroidales bacterium OttesenSCG-928-A17]